MTKIKTHKATAKRYIIKKSGKITHRKAGQDHYNARESGNTKRNKRKDVNAHESLTKTIKSLMPHN